MSYFDGPQHRAPRGVRLAAGVLAVCAALFVAGLMLSDRAPGVLRATFGDAAQQLWERIDADRRAELRDVIGAGGAPGTDDVVHVVVWAGLVALFALTVWTWRGVVAVSVAVLVASAAVELAQGRWSSTRAVEASDLVANTFGVAVGAVGAVSVLAVGEAVGRLRASGR